MTNLTKIQDLWSAWLRADEAWTVAIKTAYPKSWPGDVRYNARGEGAEGSALRQAYDTYKAAREAFETAGGFAVLFDRNKDLAELSQVWARTALPGGR